MSEPIAVTSARRIHALQEVGQEMEWQIEKWGVQEHPSFKFQDVFGFLEEKAREAPRYSGMPMTDAAKWICDQRLSVDDCSWMDILGEEVLEARDEAVRGDLVKLREELIQVAAVALSWVGSIDRETNRCLECGLTEGQHKISCTTGYKEKHND